MSPAATPGAVNLRAASTNLLTGTAALLALLAALTAGCRGGLGTTCRCAADCRAGLVCRAEGEKALADELCYKPGLSGLCVESDDIEDSGTPVELTEAPAFLDMPSKRDFQPSGSISDSATGTTDATTSPASTGDTSTSTSTGDTSTGTSTGTGTTSTSTGGSSTGSTGSTGGSSSGSTGGSTGSTGSSTGSTGGSTGSTT